MHREKQVKLRIEHRGISEREDVKAMRKAESVALSERIIRF